jgi:transposase-like protein
MEVQFKAPVVKVSEGKVHCPMCTHSVTANVEYTPRQMRVAQGQKCERCGVSLDVAVVLYLRNAA